MKKKVLIITSAALAVTALTFVGLFVWKTTTANKTASPGGSHKVTWVDENNNVLEADDAVADGEMPEYNGEKPASYDTEIDGFGEKYRYAFNGWDHPLAPVTEDVTYKAVMKAHSLVTTIVLNTPEKDNSVYRYFAYVGELEKVDWGDGTIDRNVAHAYDTPTSQKVTIRIYGEMTELHFAYDYSAFDGIYACKGIDSIHLSYSITSIPSASMEDINTASHLAPLQKIFIPSSVKFIADEALYLSQGGTVLNVEFEEGIELDYIGVEAFWGNGGLGYQSFTFGKNMIIHNICYNAFFQSPCSTFNFADGTRIDHIEAFAFGYVETNPVSVSFGNNCVLGDLYLRPSISNLPLTMYQLSFGNNCHIHALNESVGDDSSEVPNNNLKAISFGDNCYIETFGSFSYFDALTSIQFGKNTFVENMSADHMFTDCPNLALVTFPEMIGSELGSYTFYGSNISYITLPKNIKFIPDCFAYGCSNLTSITIPQSVEYIGAYAFSNTFLEKVIFEEGSHLKSIELCAFYAIHSFELKIEFPEGLESIQSELFEQSSSLIEEIKIPKSVKFIDASAFYYCNLLSIEFAEDSNLVSFGEYALQGTQIKTLVLPNKLEYVGYELCKQCYSLEYIKLPANLQYLGYGAFTGCTSLVTADLTALSDLPLTDADGMGNEAIFSDCDRSKLTIYVSNQTVYDKLTSEEGKQMWGDFTVIIGQPPLLD